MVIATIFGGLVFPTFALNFVAPLAIPVGKQALLENDISRSRFIQIEWGYYGAQRLGAYYEDWTNSYSSSQIKEKITAAMKNCSDQHTISQSGTVTCFVITGDVFGLSLFFKRAKFEPNLKEGFLEFPEWVADGVLDTPDNHFSVISYRGVRKVHLTVRLGSEIVFDQTAPAQKSGIIDPESFYFDKSGGTIAVPSKYIDRVIDYDGTLEVWAIDNVSPITPTQFLFDLRSGKRIFPQINLELKMTLQDGHPIVILSGSPNQTVLVRCYDEYQKQAGTALVSLSNTGEYSYVPTSDEHRFFRAEYSP